MILSIGLILLLLLCFLPVTAWVTGQTWDGRQTLRVEIRLLGGLIRVERDLVWTISGLDWVPASLGLLAVSQPSVWGSGGAYLARRWRIKRLAATVRIGAGSPALTAVVYGLVWGMVGAALGIIDSRWTPVGADGPRVEVEADFRRPYWAIHFDCIFVWRTGDAIIAGWLELRNRYRRLLVQKTAIPSPPDQPAHSA